MINYKNIIKIIIIILYINPLRVKTFFKCCDEESVKIKHTSSQIELITHSKPVNSNTLTQDLSSDKKYQKDIRINSTVTTFLTNRTTCLPNTSKSLTSHKPSITEKPIFTITDLNNLEIFFIQINSIINNEKASFKNKVEDQYNENEIIYLRKKNYHKIFEKHLPFITQKFISFVYQNLDTPHIKQRAKEQIAIIDQFLSRFNDLTTFNSHQIFTEWLEQIIEDEIQEKNITLSYIPQYIEESIIPEIPQKDFKKEKIYEYKKLLIEKIMESHTQPEESFNKQKAIKTLVKKNPHFIQVIEDIFADLFLKKISLNESKPSAQGQEDLLHVPHF